MEPAEMEMNVPVAFAVVIGAIGFISMYLAHKFEDLFRVNPSMAGDGLAGIEQIPDGTSEMDISTESASGASAADETPVRPTRPAPMPPAEEEEEEDICASICEDCDCKVDPMLPPPPLSRIVANEVLDDEVENSDEEANPLAEKFTQILSDIDSFQARLDDFDHKVETTKNLCTVLGESAIKMNDATVNTLTERISGLQNSLQKEFKLMADTQDKLSESVHESKVSIGMLLAKPQPLTESSLMNYATLESVNFMKKMMTDEFKMSLTDYATLRSVLELKTQMDDLLKRNTIQKTVYQAWNGSAKWTDFNEGSLNIQMIRKKFTTAEQNEEWLLPENKTIAAYNRDQLLGLNEDNWTTADNTIFTKRYYKDDWDASVEVAITVTLSKKILVPPGGKPEVTISHILRKLSEKEQIQWEHLLVNA